ncbi:MAG: SpoIIE family protein phosphatase, partial [Oscillospiraceae bacterium]|nr:SpoIIE family protein phosphatase [Oscillospiraceae bacterium]
MQTIKQRLGRLSHDLGTKGEVALGRPEIMRVVECLLRFALALALSRAEIFGGYTPFGVAIVAISGPGVMGFLTFFGVVLGTWLGGDFFFGLKYIAMAVLMYAANFAFHDLRVYRKAWFCPAVAACMAAAVGFVYAQDLNFSMTAMIFYITETVLVGGGAYFFQIALAGFGQEAVDEGQTLKRTVSLLILVGTCLIALSQITGPAGVSVGRLLAVFLLMSTAYHCGVGSGSSTGAALGLAMDAPLGGTPFFSMAYVFSGLLSGMFGRYGKLLFTISFILANGVAVLWTWGSPIHAAAVYEVFLVSMVFMILPSRVMRRFAIDLGEQAMSYPDSSARTRREAKRRVKDLASAFQSLYETVKAPSVQWNNDNDIATVFDRAAEGCCRKCTKASTCWREGYEDTLNVMNNVTAPMLARGELWETDFPQHFREHCRHLPRYIDRVNFELKSLMLRRQHAARLRESQTALAAQYADMGTVLEGLAATLDREHTPEPHRERRLRRYLESQDIEAEAAVYRGPSGRLHAELGGGNLRPILRDKDRLAKLSAVLGVRLSERRAAGDTVAVPDELTFSEAEPLAAAVGIASVRRKGQPVSGDRSTYFKTDDGKLHVILCDGMGTGAGAARESGQLSDILEQFLQAGLDPEAAMKLLNGAFQVKNGALTGYASVDLLRLDLFTGQTRLFKYGAAPSYFKRGRTVRAAEGESLAAGLGATGLSGPSAPDSKTVRLEPGSFVVLVSDGVVQS